MRAELATLLLDQERTGFLDHFAEFRSDLAFQREQSFEVRRREITVAVGGEEPVFDFLVFTVSVGQLADKMGFVATLGQDSAKFAPTERAARLTWLVSEYFSSAGQRLLIWKIRDASSADKRYTSSSVK